jgi:tetratricopeptide (TPR) repeat protein
MANVSKLKEKARLLEQREQWKDALQAYEEVVEQSDGDDIGLWNRIGDLHMRIGQVEQAVDAYENAVGAYADAGLHNNAIALCNKILRAVPTRIPTYLKLGQISAAQGFLADARASFLQYAERSRKAGQVDASFDALREFAELSPDDFEIRRLLADQLRAHGRTEQAVEQFRLLLGQLEARGRTAEAEDVRAQIRSIDPDANVSALGGGAQPRKQAGVMPGLMDDEDELHLLPSLQGAPSAPSTVDADPLELRIDSDTTADDVETGAPAALEGLQPTSEAGEFNIDLPAEGESGLLEIRLDMDEDGAANERLLPADEADPEPNAISLSDGPLLEELTSSAVFDVRADDAPLSQAEDDENALRLDGFESTAQDDAWENADDDGALPLLDVRADYDDRADEDARSGTSFLSEDAAEEEAADSEPLPFLSVSEEWSETNAPQAGVGAEAGDLDFPVYGYDDVEIGEPVTSRGASLDELRARYAADPDDGALRDKLVLLLREQGLTGEAESVLETAHRSFATAERFADAIDAIRGLIELRSDDTALYQKQVEYAFRSGDRARLIQAYLDLGRHLESGESAAKAVAVYQRVLDLDAGNMEARRALAPAPDAGASRSHPGRQGPPADEGYVDLAALIFEDDSREASTRFVVDEEEPTGDEDRDFADMLSRFRQKVAENIGVEDSTSHYDLGLAFKDMGLLDEAISQFQVALRGGADPLATLEVLGECFVEKRQFTLASRVLDRALRLPDVDESSLIGVYYWLGRCDETLGRTQTAQDFFERVLSLDIRFRDAASRLETLRANGP